MSIVRKFLIAELAWGTAISLLVLPVTIMSSDPLTAAEYIRWVERALGLAMFPAGIAIAADVFATPRSWRPLVAALLAAGIVALLLFAMQSLVLPRFSGERALPRLLNEMRTAANSWEGRNDAAWLFYGTMFVPLYALLLAGIGIQVGVWARYALPVPLRRLLYWGVGISLMMTGYAVSDSTYEVIVLHTAAFVDFAAFYTLLIPAGICAGLALPTLALLRGSEIPGRAR